MPVVDDHPGHVNASEEMAKDLDETEIVVEKKKRRFRRIKLQGPLITWSYLILLLNRLVPRNCPAKSKTKHTRAVMIAAIMLVFPDATAALYASVFW